MQGQLAKNPDCTLRPDFEKHSQKRAQPSSLLTGARSRRCLARVSPDQPEMAKLRQALHRLLTIEVERLGIRKPRNENDPFDGLM